MKLHGVTKVQIPWTDAEGMRQWSVLTFRGTVDRRRVWREARKFIERNFKKSVRAAYLRSLPLINTYDDRVEIKDDVYKEFVEAFIQRMQDETEDGTDSESQAVTSS